MSDEFKSEYDAPDRWEGCGGLGQYARGQHELLLFCTRGRGYDVRRAHGARRRSTWIGQTAVSIAREVLDAEL